MSAEQHQSLNYYGEGTGKLLEQGKKIVTLRLPNQKYDIPAGTEAQAVCPDTSTQVPITVIDNQTRPLRDFSPPSLLLDGYLTATIAAEDLRRYYNQVEDTTPMQRIATLPLSIWSSLAPEEQERLLALGLDAALQDSAFRKIFMPSLFFWFATYQGDSLADSITIHDWHEWLIHHHLATRLEIERKMCVNARTIKFYNDVLFDATALTLIANEYEADSAEYRSVVVHEPLPLR